MDENQKEKSMSGRGTSINFVQRMKKQMRKTNRSIRIKSIQKCTRQSNSAAPPSRSAPSQSAPFTFAPSSSTSDVSFRDIMTQLQCMDARLDTLSTELYQVNIRVGCIARQQAIMGGFAPEASPSPPPVAFDFEDENDDDGDNDDASDNDDGDASSIDEMST